MKVLFQGYNTCCQNPAGGVQIRIRRLREALTKMGVHVDFFNPFETKVADYDVLHVFKLNAENASLVNYAKQIGLKIILSSIVSLENGFQIDFFRFMNRLRIPTIYKLSLSIIDKCDSIIVETPAESEFLSKHYGVSPKKILIIPNGVEVPTLVPSQTIYGIIGGTFPFILQVGIFHPNKNQINVIRAMHGTNIHVVFIGGFQPDTELYYKKCIQAAAGDNHFHFLGWQSEESQILQSAYQNANILVLPSYRETFGMVAIEGAISGANVCISKTLPILSYGVFKQEYTFDPYNLKNIRDVLLTVMKQAKDRKVQMACQQTFSWPVIAKQHIDCYQQLES